MRPSFSPAVFPGKTLPLFGNTWHGGAMSWLDLCHKNMFQLCIDFKMMLFFTADQIPFHCRYMKFAKPLYEIAHSLESLCLRCRNNISVASVQAKPLEQKLPLIRLEDREGFQRQQAHQLCVYIYRMSMKYFFTRIYVKIYVK